MNILLEDSKFLSAQYHTIVHYKEWNVPSSLHRQENVFFNLRNKQFVYLFNSLS